MAGRLGGWVIAKVKELWCSACLSPFNVSTILNQTSIARRIIHPIVAHPLGAKFHHHLLVIEVSPNAQLQALLCQAPPVEESTSSSSSSSASDSSG